MSTSRPASTEASGARSGRPGFFATGRAVGGADFVAAGPGAAIRKRATPAAETPRISGNAAMSFSLVRNMEDTILSVKNTTRAETVPVANAAARLVPYVTAARAVPCASAAGTVPSGGTSLGSGPAARLASPRSVRRVAEPGAGTRQPRLERTQRAVHHPRRLLVTTAHQVAERHRVTILLGQSRDLFADDRRDVVRVAGSVGGGLVGHRGSPPLVLPASGGVRPGPRRDPRGRAEQPARHRLPLLDRARPPDQCEERRLKGILGVVRVVEHAPAEPQHHRPVPRHQRLERRILAVEEPPQQLAVGQRSQGPGAEQRLQVVHQLQFWLRVNEPSSSRVAM